MRKKPKLPCEQWRRSRRRCRRRPARMNSRDDSYYYAATGSTFRIRTPHRLATGVTANRGARRRNRAGDSVVRQEPYRRPSPSTRLVRASALRRHLFLRPSGGAPPVPDNRTPTDRGRSRPYVSARCGVGGRVAVVVPRPPAFAAIATRRRGRPRSQAVRAFGAVRVRTIHELRDNFQRQSPSARSFAEIRAVTIASSNALWRYCARPSIPSARATSSSP